MVQNHSVTCDRLKRDVDELDQMLENGEDVTDFVGPLKKLVSRMHREADLLSKVLHESPVRRIFSTDRLNVTEQQLLLARAAGFSCFTAKSLGVSPITDYEAYRLCVCEDNESVWFLHPDERPASPPRRKGNTVFVRGKAALSPEEVDIAHLRPEQVEFINKHRPDVLPRLGSLKQNGRVQPDPEVAASPHGRE
jgi:hypothetical protein